MNSGNDRLGDCLHDLATACLSLQHNGQKPKIDSQLTSHDNELRDTSVEGLSSLVSSLLELLVVRCLLDKVQNGVGQTGVSERESLGVHGGRLIKIYGLVYGLIKGECIRLTRHTIMAKRSKWR